MKSWNLTLSNSFILPLVFKDFDPIFWCFIDKVNLLIQVTFHSVLSPIMLASPDNFYGQLHIASLNGLNSFLLVYSDFCNIFLLSILGAIRSLEAKFTIKYGSISLNKDS